MKSSIPSHQSPVANQPSGGRLLLPGFLLLSLVTGFRLAAGEPLTEILPSACGPRVEDYTFIEWADGVRGRSADGRWLRVLQTGRYAMALDVESVQITALGPLPGLPAYAHSVTLDNSVWQPLPPAELELSLTVDGKAFRCVRGGPWSDHRGPRIVESGRFFQRADITDLVFRAAGGQTLNVNARFETAAWPDRLTLTLFAMPGRRALAAGPCFGRVGGGYFLDGQNHLEVAHAPELEPAQLTLELWVFIPDGPSGTRFQPWLVCKNGNEWAQGNYGITLVNGTPTALLNIGGGRDHLHTVAAKTSSGRATVLARECWQHLAMTYDGRALRLYVNGAEHGSQVVNQARQPGQGALAIGRRQDNDGDGYHFRGVVDEIRLYRRPLPAQEIAAHAKSPESASADMALVRAWSFDPLGPACAQRPSEVWTNAQLGVALRSGGRTFQNTVLTGSSDVWTNGVWRSASVSLAPGPTGIAEAPLTTGVSVSALALTNDQPLTVEHHPDYDWFRVDLVGVEPVGQHNDALERVRLRVVNRNPVATPVRLLFDKSGHGIRVRGIQPMTGLSPLLRDADGFPTGLPVQVSKNWHSQPGLDLVHQGAWFHGFSLLRLPARSQVELEFNLAYAHWGGVAAASHAQLCLIGWGSNQLWDQSAIGAWGESICYEPDQAQAEAAVLDVRPLMVHAMNSDTPTKWAWTGNVGGADFFRYFDPQGRRVFPARMKTAYLRQGPVLTEVAYAGQSGDGKLEHRATVSLWRTDDVVRGLYRLRLDVKQVTDFSRFVIFQVGADTYSYTGERQFAVGNETGLVREWATQWGGNTHRTAPMECTGRVPWFSLHEAVSRDPSKSGAWANRGVVIRHWDARLGGKSAQPWAAEYGVAARGDATSLLDIMPPPAVKRLQPGDYVEATFEHVVLPQFAHDYYGPNEPLRAALRQHENTWRLIYREAVGNDVLTQVTTGHLEQRWPVRIRATDRQRARFSLTGGLGYVPVTISGLASARRPVLELRESDRAWRAVDQSVHGHDFWQADAAADGTFEITYTLPLDTAGDQRAERFFRFRLE